MDIFKLLARSTNLKQSVSALNPDSSKQIPSAGAPHHPRTFDLHNKTDIAGNLVSSTDCAPKGTKRKKVQRRQEREDGISEELDFFNEVTKPIRDVREQPTLSSKDSGPEDDHQKDNWKPPEEVGFLEETECKRILRANKIKIMLVKIRSSRNGSATKRRKGLGDDPSRPTQENNGYEQILPQPLISFAQLRTRYGISKRLAANIQVQGYRIPTEVQLGSLPLLLGSDQDRGLQAFKSKKNGHRKSPVDLLTIAPTGSGKTLAYLIPALNELLRERQAAKIMKSENTQAREEHQLKAIVIAPTRELADQIVNEGRKLALGTGIKIVGMRKGMRLSHWRASDQEHQFHGFEGNGKDGEQEEEDWESGTDDSSPVKADVLISTPLMLLHSISPGGTSKQNHLHSVHTLVLDEADVLLDPLFRSQTLEIWSACTNPFLRVSLWSATIGSSIETLARQTIISRQASLKIPSEPCQHLIRVIVGLKDSAIQNISHRLVYAATEQGKLLALRQILHPAATGDGFPTLRPPFLVFTQTIPRAAALHSELLYDIPPSAGGSSRIAVLHSSLSLHMRSDVMARFRAGEVWILITTDLLSRGIDFKGINGVVNYDIPISGASYVHRVGRTGRAGREGGVAITLYTKEDFPHVKAVANVIAASEKAREETKDGGDSRETGGVKKWLLDALPKPTKKAKKVLKRRGVEARRSDATRDPAAGTENKRGRSKMRISTKSGFDRRVENKRRGAVAGSQKRALDEGRERGVEEETRDLAENGEVGEWGGFD